MPKRQPYNPNTVAGFIYHRLRAQLELLERPKPENFQEILEAAVAPRFELDAGPFNSVLEKLGDRNLENVTALYDAVTDFHFSDPTLKQVMIVAAALKCKYGEFNTLLSMVEKENHRRLVPDSLPANKLHEQYDLLERQAKAIYEGKSIPVSEEAQGRASQKIRDEKRGKGGRGSRGA